MEVFGKKAYNEQSGNWKIHSTLKEKKMALILEKIQKVEKTKTWHKYALKRKAKTTKDNLLSEI